MGIGAGLIVMGAAMILIGYIEYASYIITFGIIILGIGLTRKIKPSN